MGFKYNYADHPPSSKFRGVSYHKMSGKWDCRICVHQSFYYFGLYDDEITAAIIYDTHCERLGVPSRSNNAAIRFASELPISGPAILCKTCNGANVITGQRLSEGEWIEDDTIPCPICQKTTTTTS